MKITEEDIEMIAEALLIDDCGDLLRSDSLDWENVRRLPQYQQILENQKIVEKIKEWIFHEELLIKKPLEQRDEWARSVDECISELKEILGDDMK